MKTKFLSIAAMSMFLMITIACKKKGGDANAKAAEEVAAASAKATTYNVDVSQSKVVWSGSKPTGKHAGTVAVKSGSFAIKDGTIESGNFELDMTSITVTDENIKPNMKANLEAHLKGTTEGKENDFFNVSDYPTGKFAITKVTKLMNDPNASHIVNGNLTLRDITKNVSFRARVDVTGNRVVAKSVPFEIDRTEWGVRYGSKKFFDDLKDNFVNDNIGLQVEIVATAK